MTNEEYSLKASVVLATGPIRVASELVRERSDEDSPVVEEQRVPAKVEFATPGAAREYWIKIFDDAVERAAESAPVFGLFKP